MWVETWEDYNICSDLILELSVRDWVGCERAIISNKWLDGRGYVDGMMN
jgi:hypothetical protein